MKKTSENETAPPASANASSAVVMNELNKAASFSAFLAENEENMLAENLSEHLMDLLKQKKRRRADVVHDAGLDKAYVYQIFDGKKRPSRDKLIAIAFGLHLNKEETQRMLKVAGYSELYVRIARDALILYCIGRGYDIWQTDDKLYEHGFPLLHPDT